MFDLFFDNVLREYDVFKPQLHPISPILQLLPHAPASLEPQPQREPATWTEI